MGLPCIDECYYAAVDFIVDSFRIAVFPMVYLYMKIVTRKDVGTIIRKCVWIYGRVWQFLLYFFVSFQGTGLGKEKFDQPSIIVVNHRSFFDTYCMNMFPVFNIYFAIRAWPFKIFLFSLFMKFAQYLNIESTPWDEIRISAGRIFKNGGSILFFPEGHRSKDAKLTRFYSGAFKLACEFNVPVIPICLTGTGTLLPPKRLTLAPLR